MALGLRFGGRFLGLASMGPGAEARSGLRVVAIDATVFLLNGAGRWGLGGNK
ncbi:MAG: hypothetical protein R3F39_20465 [Myxococcota bacterium]